MRTCRYSRNLPIARTDLNQGQSNNMRGTFPYDVSFLSALTSFIVTREPISGPFPDWSKLTTLEQLLVSDNELTGTFPFFLLQQNPLLGTIFLSRNNFEGSLPAFRASPALQDLRVDENDFSGAIPQEISNLASLSTYGDSIIAITSLFLT